MRQDEEKRLSNSEIEKEEEKKEKKQPEAMKKMKKNSLHHEKKGWNNCVKKSRENYQFTKMNRKLC